MSFKNKLLLCIGVPSLAFVLAIALLAWTVQRSQQEYRHHIEIYNAQENLLRDMYTQGLQMGQALRNIVLGILGGFVGSILFGLIGLSPTGIVGEIPVSVVGACDCIWIGRKLFK